MTRSSGARYWLCSRSSCSPSGALPSGPPHALGYQPELGEPWFWIGASPIYPPPAFFWWWFAFDAYAPSVFVHGAFIAVSGGFLSFIVAIAMSIWRARERRKAETFGSARWANAGEIRKAGMLGDAGVILGGSADRICATTAPNMSSASRPLGRVKVSVWSFQRC
jgi:type IV secretory pathway TraG/TraD family ATPase VirD4